ncbi:hypothetical protein GDO81_025538, partial [Engystomops pustulosus]
PGAALCANSSEMEETLCWRMPRTRGAHRLRDGAPAKSAESVHPSVWTPRHIQVQDWMPTHCIASRKHRHPLHLRPAGLAAVFLASAAPR